MMVKDSPMVVAEGRLVLRGAGPGRVSMVGILLGDHELEHEEGEMYQCQVVITPLKRWVPKGRELLGTTLGDVAMKLNDDRAWEEG